MVSVRRTFCSTYPCTTGNPVPGTTQRTCFWASFEMTLAHARIHAMPSKADTETMRRASQMCPAR
jgi:hypothetical protein